MVSGNKKQKIREKKMLQRIKLFCEYMVLVFIFFVGYVEVKVLDAWDWLLDRMPK
jgi:hypothetical protein